jgi:hypothetical protein
MNIYLCLFLRIKEALDTANLRKISLTKRGTEPKGDNIYVSNVARQYKLKYRATNFCNQSSIFLLDENKKPVLTLSSTINSDGKTNVYATFGR